MGVTKQQAIENRRAILVASERLFRERGVNGVGLTELMKAAGFTQGGFYNHFESKEALAAEVVREAVAKANKDLETELAGTQDRPGATLGQRVDHYLSGEHCRDVENGCAIAGLAGDVRRMGEQAQVNFADGMSRMFDILGKIVSDPNGEKPDDAIRRRRAIAIYGQMVGTLLLSRAVQDTSPDLAEEILKSGKAALDASGDGR